MAASSSPNETPKSSGGDNESLVLAPMMELGIGALVELHSLSRQEFNGRTGEIVGTQGASRFAVLLDDSHKQTQKKQKKQNPIGLKPENLRRLPPAPHDVRVEALRLAQQQGPLPALAKDRMCAWAHLRLTSRALERHQDPMPHIHRAVQNLTFYQDLLEPHEVLSLRIEHALCLGEAGRLDEEEEALNRILDVAPHHTHAKHGQAANLKMRGQDKAAAQVFANVIRQAHLDDISLPDKIASCQQDAAIQIVSHISEAINKSRLVSLISESAKNEIRQLLEWVEVALSVPELEPREQVIGLAQKGFLLGHMYVHQDGGQESWKLSQEAFRQGRFVRNVPPLTQGFLLSEQSRTLEMVGDAATDRQTQLAYYKEAMTYIKESEARATDPSTDFVYKRLQAKSHPGMKVVIDPNTGAALCQAVGGTVVLDTLPQGPRRDLPPVDGGVRFV